MPDQAQIQSAAERIAARVVREDKVPISYTRAYPNPTDCNPWAFVPLACYFDFTLLIE